MGEAGKQSRLDCLKAGAPYTYAALTEDEAAAPGQWATADMKKAVYGDFPFVGSEELSMPSSKSFAQRAIIAAALADGVSHLKGYTPCGDNEAALQVARNLGAEVQVDGSQVTIKGIAAKAGSYSNPDLHVGESGLLTRMLIPVMAQISTEPLTFTGEKTLLGRPLTGAKEIMEAFDAQIKGQGGDDALDLRGLLGFQHL